jgi:hypothetical protein
MSSSSSRLLLRSSDDEGTPNGRAGLDMQGVHLNLLSSPIILQPRPDNSIGHLTAATLDYATTAPNVHHTTVNAPTTTINAPTTTVNAPTILLLLLLTILLLFMVLQVLLIKGKEEKEVQ